MSRSLWKQLSRRLRRTRTTNEKANATHCIYATYLGGSGRETKYSLTGNAWLARCAVTQRVYYVLLRAARAIRRGVRVSQLYSYSCEPFSTPFSPTYLILCGVCGWGRVRAPIPSVYPGAHRCLGIFISLLTFLLFVVWFVCFRGLFLVEVV